MHELSITQDLLETALEYARRHRASRIVKLHLQIGEIRDFDPEWLQRYFDYLSRGTIAEGAKLDVSSVPAKIRCGRCLRDFPLDPSAWDVHCPTCRNPDTQLISGREFCLESLEVL